MADVAAISVISSGIVGVLGVIGAFHSQLVSVRTETSRRVEARRMDLRDTLAGAATVAMTVELSANHVDTTLHDVGREAARITHDMERCRGELGVRLGPDSDVYLAYRRVQIVMLALANAYFEAPAGLTIAQLNVTSRVEPEFRSLRAANAAAEEALADFLSAASGVVGAM